MSRKRCITYQTGALSLAFVILALCLPLAAFGQTADKAQSNYGTSDGEHCYTDIVWKEKAERLGLKNMACTPYGTCDIPSVRDAWAPDGTTPIVIIKLYFHILRNDNGTSPATTPEM
ncbi:MAG: hypothetical protein V3T31_02425, partial [candidate division Zixibacteria bacterium]